MSEDTSTQSTDRNPYVSETIRTKDGVFVQVPKEMENNFVVVTPLGESRPDKFTKLSLEQEVLLDIETEEGDDASIRGDVVGIDSTVDNGLIKWVVLIESNEIYRVSTKRLITAEEPDEWNEYVVSKGVDKESFTEEYQEQLSDEHNVVFVPVGTVDNLSVIQQV